MCVLLMQLYRRCEGVLLQNLTVLGSTQWGNNDGVDFESGKDIQAPSIACIFFVASIPCYDYPLRFMIAPCYQVLDSVFSTGDDGLLPLSCLLRFNIYLN